MILKLIWLVSWSFIYPPKIKQLFEIDNLPICGSILCYPTLLFWCLMGVPQGQILGSLLFHLRANIDCIHMEEDVATK